MGVRFKSLVTAALLIALALPATLAAKSYPDQTDDGLDRIKNKRLDALYRREGATLAPYARVKIDRVSVAFRKNWMRDQNRDRRSVSSRIRTEDMDRIRSELADLFREEFVDVLREGGYEVVNENGPDVLLLEPAIVDLDVTAPDIGMRQPGRSTTYTASAGEMTLNMDLVDSETGSIIGRAIDRREDHAVGNFQYSNSITNRADAQRILRSWAMLLRDALDDARDDS